MSRRSTALLLASALLPAAFAANAADRCDAMRARINQMPEIIGSGTAVQLKTEQLFRLGQLEIAIRRDMRHLQCPTASVIAWGADNAEDCSRLGEELSQVHSEQESFKELQPILSQTVDDGTGTLPALIQQMKAAGCDFSGSQQDVEIISSSGGYADIEPVALSTETISGGYSGEDTAIANIPSSEDETAEVSSSLGTGDESEYGMPSPYGMIEVRPGETTGPNGEPLTRVELPKLDNAGVIQAPGSIDGLRPSIDPKPTTAAVAPAVPDRAYNPNDRKIRRVGPAFLAEQENGIDLRHP